MQTYNQFNQGNIMPLLMNFTTPSPIQDGFDMPSTNYNDETQISYEMRTIGTRCYKSHSTHFINKVGNKACKSDAPSNIIDDTKVVK